MITEAYTSVENTMKYYGDESNLGAHLPFNFGLISYLNDHSNATDFKNAVLSWLDNMPEGKWANWVVRVKRILVFIEAQKCTGRYNNTSYHHGFSRSEITINHV